MSSPPAGSPIAVIGAGAWGQALAIHAARAGHRVRLWARDPSRIADPRRRSHRLGGFVLPDAIELTDRPGIGDAACALLAVPVQNLRDIAGRLQGETILVTCCKGIERTTLCLPLEILAELRPGAATAVLTGPNFAREIAAGLPASSVIASVIPGLAQRLAALLGNDRLRLYPGTDPVGAELGGAAKNVVAIAAGAASGAGFGQNARAALITRGLAEIARLAEALGGRPETVAGLSGAGDLILTCTGESSRNYRLGEALGRGARLDDLLHAGDEVAEGAATAPGLVARAARAGVELPIAAVVTLLLEGAIDAHEAARRLLARRIGHE